MSALTWRQLRDLRLGELDEAADGWAAVVRHADTAEARVNGDMSGALSKTQTSETATAAVKRLTTLRDNYDYLKTECGLLRSAASGLAGDLASPQRRLRQALTEAESLAFTVHEDGGIGYPAGGTNELTGTEVPGGAVSGAGALRQGAGRGPLGAHSGLPNGGLTNPNPNHAKAQDIADRIAQALWDARAIDSRYQSTFERLKAAPGLTVDARTWSDVAADRSAVRDATKAELARELPLARTPAERKAWWDGLTATQREDYLTTYPDVIGNLDGIPATVRDQANRENLGLLIAGLERADGEIAQARLEGLKGIRDQLEANATKRLTDLKEPPMYLLGIGVQGSGRAIVSYGNPDTSRNVAAYAPGLGTALDGDFANNDVKRARYTAVRAQVMDSSSAAIVWLGYDPPQLGGPDALSLISGTEVMSAERAEKGAPVYNEFMRGLSATNDHADPHLTAVGHSYGSRLVGAAAMEDGGIPGADDIVLLGSPGVGVDRAEDLGVGKDHVFVGTAENDPVTMLPSKQEAAVGAATSAFAPVGVAYVAADLADQGDDDLWFGKDPASEAFGARRFQVDDGPFPIFGGEGLTPAHSNYFDMEVDRESAANIAAVVAGQPTRITQETYR
ncbi:alpha/beta hydrolase [Streptomyces sp. NPDC047097]|uniref:alpha/beta hydrolase n=1 Tax=Streptomyces sp. NPDC047097 TaxID=3155260 RepID=UPI0033DBAE20